MTGAGRLVVSGPAKTTLKPLLQWLSRSPRSGIRAGATPSGSANVMVSPRLKVFDLAILRGAHDYGRFFFLPGSIPLKYSASHGADEYLIQRDGLPQGSRLLMVTVSGPGGFSRPDAVSMTLGAERVPELDRCECFTAENLTGYASWLLFKLPPGPADLPLRLRLGPSKGRRSALWVVALPAEAR